MADLALHNALAIPHRELESHQLGIIADSVASRQRHERGSFPVALEAHRELGPPAQSLRCSYRTDGALLRLVCACRRVPKSTCTRRLNFDAKSRMAARVFAGS